MNFSNANMGGYVASEQYLQPYPLQLGVYADQRREVGPHRPPPPQGFGMSSAAVRYPAATGYDPMNPFNNILVDAPRDIAYSANHLGQPSIITTKRNMSYDVRGDIAVNLQPGAPIGASIPSNGAYLTHTGVVRGYLY